jgi:CRP-like cAMP-binding protein
LKRFELAPSSKRPAKVETYGLPRRSPSGSPRPWTFDVKEFLRSAGVGRTFAQYRKGDVIFAQGDPCDCVLYIQTGDVKLSVLSRAGQQAVVAMLRAGDFLGEGGLAGQPVRMGSATAVTATSVLRIDQYQLIRLLHEQHAMSDRMISHLLSLLIRVEQDLVAQLFSSSERRLARKLLLLARYGEHGRPTRTIPAISQETLAEMVGTTRSRVNFFLKKFERLGFIDFEDGLRVHHSLLAVVLLDETSSG